MKGNSRKQAESTVELSESMEDYVEAISQLGEKLKVVRVKNIAQTLKVKMPSVSSALGVLAKKKLVNYEKYDSVELTDEGRRVARRLRHRHDTLKKFLTEVLGVEERNAERDSCGMEHHVSRSTIDHIVKFIEYIDSFASGRRISIEHFKGYLKGGEEGKDGGVEV